MNLVKKTWRTLPLFILALNSCLIEAKRCSLIPEGVIGPRSRIETNRYRISISGQPTSYVPGEEYTVYLQNNPRAHTKRYFKRFILVLEHEDSEYGYSEDQADKVGSLAIINYSTTTFNEDCRNSIVATNDVQISKIAVKWTAPESGSGCVIFKASVVETSKQWFSEDDLAKKLCEQNEDSAKIQPPILDQNCTACSEAKYEVTFEGLWSRNTFPHNFPEDAWTTRFSDVIGASHSVDYEFWSYDGKASEALKALAENGDTTLLEDELKDNEESIRTIIKAKGLRYPNTTGRTYATFRVDKNRHLMSLVASVVPSPDWFVGVSKYELCTESGSWLESAIYDLYPWDAGTDSGITYTDPDAPLDPGHPIRRIQSNSPNDERSPFYNNDGEEVKPLARLYLTRQKIYEKQCETEDDNQESTTKGEDSNYSSENDETQNDRLTTRAVERHARCSMTDFVVASTCSVTCGTGFILWRRSYINEGDEKRCREKLVKTEPCQAAVQACPPEKYLSKDDEFCKLSAWGNYSSCSTDCGRGTKTRERKYIHPQYEEACEANPNKAETVENIQCYGDGNNDCDPTKINKPDNACQYGSWTKCNVTCGNGIKARYLLSDGTTDECPEAEIVICYEPPCSLEDKNEKNEVQGTTSPLTAESLVVEGPHLPTVNCEVSQWSSWSRCEPISGNCGHGYQYKTRTILKNALNGGLSCPTPLKKGRPCTKRCKSSRLSATPDPLQALWGPSNPSEIVVDCVMSEWGPWGPCTQTCNPGAVRMRQRFPRIPPNKYGKKCPAFQDYQPCVNLPRC